ncbi:CotH kinase family protein [Pseudomonadota bacterium]
MQNKIVLAVLGVLLLAGIVIIENQTSLFPLKNKLQSKVIPTAYLDQGQLGKVLKYMNLVHSEANDNTVLRISDDTDRSILRASLFPKNRKIGSYLYRANPGQAFGLPSSTALQTDKLAPGLPVISIAIDKEHLFNSKNGIISNGKNKGEGWEKPGYLSYFTNNKLLFATGIGVRIHGRREFPVSLDGPHGFRFYFRNDYGYPSVRSGTLFEQSSIQVSRVVARKDKGGFFINELSYDVARQIGALVPLSNVALLYINGENLGIHSVTEQVGRRQWQSRLGHNNFEFYRYKSKNDPKTNELYKNLYWRWLGDTDHPISMEKAASKFDIDNLVRNLFTFMFLGTTDWAQGALVLDRSRPSARWHWVIWDLDHSFRDNYRTTSRKTWEQPAINLVAKKANYNNWKRIYTHSRLRGKLFVRLLNDSKTFQSIFVRTVMDLLNHRLTNNYFSTLIEKHMNLATNLPNSDSIRNELNERYRFLTNRPNFIRGQIVDFFNINGIHSVSLIASKKLPLQIDGYPEQTGYSGQYFHGSTISVRVKSPNKVRFWKVNGQKVFEDQLELHLYADTVIEPVVEITTN